MHFMYLDGKLADLCLTNWEENEPIKGKDNKSISYQE